MHTDHSSTSTSADIPPGGVAREPAPLGLIGIDSADPAERDERPLLTAPPRTWRLAKYALGIVVPVSAMFAAHRVSEPEGFDVGDMDTPPAAAVATMPEQAVLFIFARNADAPAGPPVAAKRISRPQFPLKVQLSDADSLMPSAKLSATARVMVSARFARSGSVQPDAGDLVAEPVLVEVAKASAPIALTLAPSTAPTDAARAPTFGP